MSANAVYFIWGEEEYLIDEEIGKVISMAEQTGAEPEIVYVDADELDAMGLAQTLEFSPLFAMSRVVIIKKPFWLGKAGRKVKKMEEAIQVIKDYLAQDCAGQTLILTALERNASNPLIKLFDKQAQVINCKLAGTKDLADWVKEEFRKRNRKVNNAAINLLVKSGQDMYYLQNLIDKLSLIVDQRTIEEKDIEEQFNSKNAINIFKLTDALLSRNLQASLQAYYQLLTQGESPIFILYMLVRQFSILGRVKGCSEQGMGKKEIERLTGQKEFTIRKMMEKSGNFSREEIKYLFNRFLDTDVSFKTTGKDEKILMERLIIEICSKK